MKEEIIRKADSLVAGSDDDHCFGRGCSRRENCVRYLLHVRDSRKDKDRPHFYVVEKKGECPLFRRYKEKSAVYVSIPISGLPLKEVKKRARQVKSALEKNGSEVFTPFDVADSRDVPKGMDEEQTYAFYMGRDIERLLNCDTVFFCKGWQYSKGCRAEYEVAMIYGKGIVFESRINES